MSHVSCISKILRDTREKNVSNSDLRKALCGAETSTGYKGFIFEQLFYLAGMLPIYDN